MLKRILEHEMRGQRRLFRLAILAAAGLGVAGALLPALSGWFISAAALAGAAGPAAAIGFNTLLPSAGIRLFAILRTACRYGERLAGHEAALRVMARVRSQIFLALAAAPPRQALALAAGDAAARVTNDVGEVEAGLVRHPAVWAAASAALAGLAVLAAAGAAAAVLTLLATAAVSVSAWSLGRRGAEQGARAAELAGALKEDAMQLLSARAELRAYGLEQWAASRIAQSSGALAAAQGQAVAAASLFEPIAAVLAGLAGMGALALAASRSLPVAALAALASFATVEMAAAWGRGLQRRGHLGTATRRLEDVLGSADARPRAAPQPLAARINLPGWGVRLESGHVLGVTGPSGCGKTTMLETLAGLREAGPGQIAIDGTDLARLPPGCVRPWLSLLAQDAPVLAGTVRDNLLLARGDATEADLWAVLRCAALDTRVAAWPGTLDTWVGEGGARLSGGERRRLCLARALLRPAPWLLLDEPTEGLEAATEALVIQRLRGWLAATGQGAVIVTHRPALLTLCDRVIRLEAEGRCAAPIAASHSSPLQ